MKNSVDGAKFKPQRKNARGRHRTDELCSHDSNEVDIELDDVDITSAETKATYDEIKKPIGILQGKSLPRILRQNKYVMN